MRSTTTVRSSCSVTVRTSCSTKPANNTKPSTPPAPTKPAPGKGHCHGGSHFDPKPSKPSTPPTPSTPSTPGIPSSPVPTSPVPTSPQAQQALSKMDALLNEATDGKRGNGAAITHNAADVEKSSNTNPKSERYKAAQAQVQANAQLESQSLSRLSSGEQQRYASVKNALTQANNPVAALALQKLLVGGRLDSGLDFANQGSVLQHLQAIAQGQDLDPRVDKTTLLTDLVQELATPSVINQGGRGTCAPTALSIELNLERPAEYARLMRGVASPSGQVKLANGQVLTREQDTSFKDDHSSRALTQRLLAPVLMEVANGTRDYRDSASKENRNAGATGGGLDKLYDALFNRDMATSYGQSAEWKKNTGMAIIERELQQGQNILAGIRYGDSGGHKLLVTGMETVKGQQYVKYINPWGAEERMSKADFQARLFDVNYDPLTPAKLAAQQRVFLAA